MATGFAPTLPSLAVCLLLALLSVTAPPALAFTAPDTSLLGPSPRVRGPRGTSQSSLQQQQQRGQRPASPLSTRLHAEKPDVVVISPPGGIGEIASVESAKLGASVRWFVVSLPSTTAGGNAVKLSSATVDAISSGGGSFELAGAAADSLIGTDGAPGSALGSIDSWTAGSSSLLVTYDGCVEEAERVQRGMTAEQRETTKLTSNFLKNSIRVAARQAAEACSAGATSVLVLGGDEDVNVEEKKEKGLLGSLFGGEVMEVPTTLDEAVGGSTVTVRCGELFGAAESSPESSPFVGGPRRDPIVREMYTQRSVRVDPTVSTSGNVMVGEGSKTNRLSAGEASARLALRKLSSKGGEVLLSSFAGDESPTEDVWSAEFDRVNALVASGASARLFAAEFAGVPDVKRLTEWVATKWAPAILRSYDIAGTRVGARPVVAIQTEDGKVEIVWQELVDFESVTSGRMYIEVSESGMTATRGPGDPKRGFGSVSRSPLPGEDVLVRRLADAASQATEKGLAIKPTMKKVKVESKPAKPAVEVTSVPPEPAVTAAAAPVPENAGPGPRSGARRSDKRIGHTVLCPRLYSHKHQCESIKTHKTENHMVVETCIALATHYSPIAALIRLNRADVLYPASEKSPWGLKRAQVY
ncbi:hypothetical protein THAOC_18062 [Thalassiosira oceanica]|uniref:Uncharacterized protein n=1 Tax=Thalassiosira oceanica TaxID=159749 RepID=K0S824_THAOC|nr:hypothetical protein THAOC_18062 [Thalassiosira oceanica]|eukprot:EJK61450.1 hypothetical protein THAOC_18062 [Thalassiosira oceanica]